MAIEKVAMKAVKIRYRCDMCGQGEMHVSVAAQPEPQPGVTPRIPHRCTQCGHTDVFTGAEYPHLTFEEDVPDGT